MKKLYVIFSFLFCYFTNAQIVNIPDPVFKAKLLDASVNNVTASFGVYPNLTNTTIDTNGDGEIQYSEAEVITYLYLVNSGINDLTGIEAFINLTHLGCSINNLTSINVSLLTNLIGIGCFQNQLTSLDISNLPNLRILSCQNNQISSLNFANNPLLEKVFCSNNLVSNLDFSNNPLFNELDCMNNPNLRTIKINNGTTQLFGPQTIYNQCWTGCPNLNYICADSNEMSALQNFLDNCGVDTFVITFDSNCALGNEEFAKNEMVVYPNPFKNSFKISLKNLTSDNVILKVYDVLGKTIEIINVSFQELENLELGKNYQSGLYNVVIQQGNNYQSTRIIKE
jgi:Leucine-rich repeat (LRR) protein